MDVLCLWVSMGLYTRMDARGDGVGGVDMDCQEIIEDFFVGIPTIKQVEKTPKN